MEYRQLSKAGKDTHAEFLACIKNIMREKEIDNHQLAARLNRGTPFINSLLDCSDDDDTAIFHLTVPMLGRIFAALGCEIVVNVKDKEENDDTKRS